MNRKLAAEFIGTFWLVFGGCGSAIFAASVVPGGIGFLGVALAFGLTVLTMCYAVGSISGGHFNPAVTIGLVAAGRASKAIIVPYIIAQVLGAIVASTILYFIASGQSGFTTAGGFAANGYGAYSPGRYSLAACLATEVILTAGFLLVIIGTTAVRSLTSFAPISIGLALTLIHLISIPITNTSVNPARSTGQALFAGGWAIAQLWLFWLAPIVGALLAGWFSRSLFVEELAADQVEADNRTAYRDTGKVANY